MSLIDSGFEWTTHRDLVNDVEAYQEADNLFIHEVQNPGGWMSSADTVEVKR